MKPQVGDLRTVTQRFDGKEWVLCLQSMPPTELSDEEIHDIADKFIERFEYEPWTVDEIGFAKAILKKASEK